MKPQEAILLASTKKKLPLPRVEYLLTILLSLLLFGIITRAWKLQPTLPIFYSWDSIFTGSFIKSVIDTGWLTANPYIGTPDGYHLADFPINADNFHFLIIKLLSFFTGNYAIIYNLYYLLSFPLTALTSYFVFKQLGLRFPFALAGTLLFTLQPYHFYKGNEGHLFLAAYFIVPIAIWFCVLIAKQRYVSPLTLVISCILISANGIYYALFGLFFIAVSGLVSVSKHRKIKPLLQAGLLCVLITVSLLANFYPTIKYRLQYGPNTETTHRIPPEADLYGMRITQLLLPIDNGYVAKLAEFKNKYNESSSLLNNENKITTLGLAGSAGFLILLAIILLGIKTSEEIDLFAKLNLAAVLLATIGGFGSFTAYTLTPIIRCYARISIFIAFFSLYALFYYAQKATGTHPYLKSKRNQYLLIFVIFLIGILSQVSRDFTNLQNDTVKASFRNDQSFITQIEDMMPAGSAIYQLPYVPFPENPPVFHMGDYEQLRPYLHSHNLKWSYGAMRGRPVATWASKTSELPANQLLLNLGIAGFNGIYINRNGFEDNGAKIEKSITALIGKPPITSPDGTLSFFDLRQHQSKLRKSMTMTQWGSHVINFHNQVNVSHVWGKGFYEAENSNNQTWRWSNKKSSLYITNYTNKPMTIDLSFKAFSSDNKASDLILSDSRMNYSLKINSAGTDIVKSIVIMPGSHKLTFNTNADKVITSNDPREMYFRIENFKLNIH